MLIRCCSTILFIFIIMTTVFGETKKSLCDCPKTQFTGTKADTTFNFSNGKSIALCGFKIPNRTPSAFSEFILAVCGQDTIIDYWSSELNCQLHDIKDTLFVNQLQVLPVGRNFKPQEIVWTTEKIYFSGNKLFRDLLINREIGKYTSDEIQSILNAYETATTGLDDNKMEIATKLFIATISGNNKARQYLKEFKNKFGELDGAFEEEYSNLIAMLELWDKKE